MSTDPDWNLFRSFLAILQDGSLSAAARRLGLTQPTLARHIESLEADLGAALFLRSNRGLVPTELAQALRPQAELMAQTAAALVRKASGPADGLQGCVRISASEVIGVDHLPPILTALRVRHPGLVFELEVSNTVSNLLRRDADIAVRNLTPTQDALLSRHLPGVTLGLHASPDYLDRHGTPQSLADLANHALIGPEHETPALRAMIARFPQFDLGRLALRTDNNLAQMAAMQAGFGIGLCQVRAMRPGRPLVRVLATEVAIDLGVWVVMHEDLRHTARYRAVFDGLVAGLSGG